MRIRKVAQVSRSMFKILHVEDDPDIQEITYLALQLSERFEVRQCSCASEAILLAKEYVADLLLLDMMMPGMNGDSLLSELRMLPQYEDTPVIFMTARANSEEVAALKQAGGIAVITKPFEPLTLAGQIMKVLNDGPVKTRV
ncbi:response regulator [Roseovarius bejariae]|nr:response regulator [Roseovarius bejariae]